MKLVVKVNNGGFIGCQELANGLRTKTVFHLNIAASKGDGRATIIYGKTVS